MLQVGLSALGTASSKNDYPGLRWNDRNNKNITGGIVSFNDIYGWLILDFFIYLVLAIYLDNVVKSMNFFTFFLDFFSDFLLFFL